MVSISQDSYAAAQSIKYKATVPTAQTCRSTQHTTHLMAQHVAVQSIQYTRAVTNMWQYIALTM